MACNDHCMQRLSERNARRQRRHINYKNITKIHKARDFGGYKQFNKDLNKKLFFNNFGGICLYKLSFKI